MSVKKSPKIQKLVVNAIRKLQDVQGSTPREISNYISQEYDVPSTEIARQVRLALNRAVSYGILQRSQGGYYACNREFIGCQPRTLTNVQPMDKCGRARRRVRMKCGGGGGGKSRRRRRSRAAAGGGSCKRSSGRKRRRGKRGGGGGGCGGGKSRRRRSRRGKSGDGCGGKSRRRRRRGGGGGGGGRRRRSKSRCGGGGGGKSRRRRRRARSRRGGKQCGDGGEGGKGSTGNFFKASDERPRGANFSETREENRQASVSPSVSDDEIDEKTAYQRNNDESPETMHD